MSAPLLQQYQQGITVVSADGLNTFEQTCDTLSQLRAFPGTAGMQVYSRGQNALTDGGQGAFYAPAASPAFFDRRDDLFFLFAMAEQSMFAGVRIDRAHPDAGIGDAGFGQGGMGPADRPRDQSGVDTGDGVQ